MTPAERIIIWQRLLHKSKEYYFPGSKDLTGLYKMERWDPYHLPTTKLNPLMRKYNKSTGAAITPHTVEVFYDFMQWLAKERAAEQQKKRK